MMPEHVASVMVGGLTALAMLIFALVWRTKIAERNARRFKRTSVEALERMRGADGDGI
jgi:hypothetical protein